MKGFLTFEGCEGVGKTTQVRFLKGYCEANGYDVLFTREPGGSDIAEKIRNIILDKNNVSMTPRCEALLYAAARNQHLNEVIIPRLNAGKKVVCDRFCDSTYAYQGHARGLGAEYVRALNDLSIGEYMPEYTVFLKLEPNESFARKSDGVTDRLENEGREFHKKVYEGYLKLIDEQPGRFIVIDASGDRAHTHALVVDALEKRGFFR